MKRNNFRKVVALAFAVNVIVLVAAPLRSSATQTAGQVRGTVMDTNEAGVSGAKLVIEGGGKTYTTSTTEDGTYNIELPPGIYRVKVSSMGFCPTRRAPFRLKSSARVALNFTLTVCPIVNSVAIVNGQYIGETDRYQDPFNEEVLPLAHPSSALLELLIRFKERRKDGNFIEYREATVSYNTLTIRAQKVLLNPTTFRLKAEGSVIVEDNQRYIRVRQLTVDFRTDEPKLKLVK